MIHTNGHTKRLGKFNRIYLVRHGETDYNRNGLLQGRSINASLNEHGRLQARAVAGYFEDIDIDFLASSDLDRAAQTAEPLAEMKQLELHRYREIEEIDFGRLEGRHAEGLGKRLTFIHDKWRSGATLYGPEEGESPVDVYHRANRRISSLVAQHPGATMLFVVHGRLIRILVSGWLGWGLHRMDSVPHANGGIYALDWKGGDFGLQGFNITRHLRELKIPELG